MVLSSNSKFQSLSIRPPTPPKDLDDSDKDADQVLDFLHDPFGTKAPVTKVAATKSLLNTPEQSPSSDAGIPSSSASRKKRVNFQPQPCTIRASDPSSRSFTPLHSSPLRPLPQTRVSKPLKSILKPSDAASAPPPADQGAPAHKYKSFAEMLESIMKQLASGRRPSSLDAYHSLHRTMQAYDKIPDLQALLDKMGLLTQFIRRDVQAVSITGNGLDSQLIAQALKLLMALVRLPELRLAMEDDFCNFIVDRIIHVAADKAMPKAMVNSHLAMLMQQTFRPKTMTPARVEKILDALDTIHDRVTGYSVLAYRIRIYRKLIQQRPEVMTRHTERWFRHTLKSLIANQKDINQSALDTAVTAAKTIGTERQVSKAVLTILNRAKSDGETFAKVVTNELDKMLDSDNAIMVPQIWAAVTSLLPGSLNKDDFPALADWLMVFQNCCNSTNDAVKVHANVAFGCLVYAVNYKEKEDTLSTWSKMLLTVPQHQLQRRGQLKNSERDAATSGYFTLLYYSLGPLASHKRLDRCWTEFVANFWTPLVHSPSPIHALAACRVVSALFNGARKPWEPRRALDLRPQAMVQREELPVLDARWVRKSLPTILKFVETLLDAAPWSVEECKDEPAKNMWLSLLHSLKAASSQEVMASTESKDAMAYLVNLLRRVWDRHTAQLALPQEKEDSWADKFCFLLETIVERLGALQFSDKCLTRNGQNEFEAASTPSQRSRQQGLRTSPLLYFIDLLVNQSEGKLSDHVRLRALKLLIEPCYESQNTRLSRLELLRDCAAVVDSSTNALVPSNFWTQTASLVKSCLEEQSADPNGVSRPLGKEYEVVVDIFHLSSTHLLGQPLGREVLVSFVDTVRREAGEGALVLAVVEKVSENVFERIPTKEQSACLPWLSVLLWNLPKLIVRRTIEQGRQKLWPSSTNVGRNPDFDPYNHFYEVLASIGSGSYHELNGRDVNTIQEFLAAFANSIHRCPVALLVVYLRKVQATIRLWVEDPNRKLQNKTQPSKELYGQVMLLWKEVCAAIERLPRKDGQILLHLEPLITAGFLSRRHGIVNMAIATWNATFGKEETLRYPAQLEQALRRLRNSVQLSLPSLDVREEDAADQPSFYESDASVEESKQQMRTPRVIKSPFKFVKSSRNSRSPAVPGASNKRTPLRRTPKVRLRHDNSQIQFEPILSSPSNPFVQESQILTERQRDMVERQMVTSNLFANLGSTSPVRPEVAVSARSPLELHSDALDANELPMETSQTPLRTLPSLGPMDVFIGSSPTPQARTRIQEVVSDQTSVATPTTVRTVRLDDNAELGSSPPRFENDAQSKTKTLRSTNTSEDVIDDSFEYPQLDEPSSISFDEGTTVDETVLAEAGPTGGETFEDMFATEIDASDMPSSTIDLQLTAQIDADMQAQTEAIIGKQTGGPPQNTDKITFAAASATPSDQAAENETEIQDTQIEMSTQLDGHTPDAETSSTSRIGDSFSSQAVDMESPQVRPLRSSSRFSTTSSPIQPTSATKRKSTGRGRGRPKKNKTEALEIEAEASPAQSELAPDADGIFDNIVVATPRKKFTAKKRKRSSLARLESEIVVPETNRKRGIRRSASLLTQVETQSQHIIVEDALASKRARRSLGQDVSGAKPTPKVSQTSQAKRLSHVQVTPKRSSARGSLVAVEQATVQAATEPVQGDPTLGEQSTGVAQQLPLDNGATSVPQQSQASVSTPSRSFAERVILTPRSIINQLMSLKDALFRSSQLVLGRQEEREIDDALFDIRREVHQAGRRGEGGSS